MNMNIEKRTTKRYFGTGMAGLALSTSLYAATPLWTYSTPNPAQVIVSSRGTATVQYTVTNQSRKSKNLILKTTPGLSASACRLVSKGSTCRITLTVNGSQIPKQGLHTGPVLCEQGNPNQCYQPAAANQLQIVRTNDEARTLVAVGSYDGNGAQTVPLSYTSTDFGQSWTVSVPQPQGTGYHNLYDVSCSTIGSCVAVGEYNNGSRLVPLSYTSTNFGQSWTASSPQPQGTGSNYLRRVSCNNKGSCAAVGRYHNGSRLVPLSYTSTDFGRSWIASSPQPQGTTGSNFLYGVSCNATGSCVAVGSYIDDGQRIPLSYTSTNFGQSWTVSSPQPQGTGNNYLLGVSCSPTGSCVTVGSYIDGPLSYTSTNFGQSWTVSSPQPQGTGAYLENVTCNTTGYCITVGDYYNGTQTVPLSYTSTDFGQSWTASSPQPQGTTGSNFLYDVSCSATGSCVTVGTYIVGSQNIPLSYTSTDFGQSWTVSSPQPQGTDSTLWGIGGA